MKYNNCADLKAPNQKIINEIRENAYVEAWRLFPLFSSPSSNERNPRWRTEFAFFIYFSRVGEPLKPRVDFLLFEIPNLTPSCA